MAAISGRVGWRTYTPTNNPLWDNVVAYYTADNTTINSKNSVLGTLVNGATYSTGKIGGGFIFDGINDYMTATETLSIDLNQPHTYSCWVNLTSGYSTKFFMSFLSMYGPSIGHTNGGYLTFFSGNVNGQISTGTALPLNTWSHVVVVFKGRTFGTGNVLFYVNGNLVSTSSLSFPDVIPTVPLTLGSRSLEGKLDECGVWSRALTAAEVTELYNAGSGKQYVAPTPTYTTRTTAFATATGITDTTILNALNTFDTGLISNGLATKMKALYPFVGGTSNTHKYNFMDARDTNAAFRLAFNGGGVHSSTGYKPNGSNGYSNTFLTPSANLSPTSSHISFYSRTNVSTTQVEMGVTTNNGDYYLIEINTSGTSYFAVNNTGLATSSDSNSLGFYVANRPSSNLINGWKNSTKIATGVNSYNPTPSILPIFIGAWNENLYPMYYSSKECAFASIGSGLTDGEASALSTLVQAMQTSLSRNV